MKRLHVLTPELVPLEFRIAGTAERGIAWFLDELVVMAAVTVLGIIAVLIGLVTAGFGMLPAVALLIVGRFVIDVGYRVWCEYRYRGRTLGKRWLGLRTVQQNGTPLLLWQAFVRNAARAVDALPAFHMLGATMIALDPVGRRSGDWLAGTAVIRETHHAPPHSSRYLQDEQNSLLLDGGAASRIRARVSTREGTVLAEFVAQSQRIEPVRRLPIAKRLAAHYREELGLHAHARLPDEAVLRGIVGVLARDRFGTPGRR